MKQTNDNGRPGGGPSGPGDGNGEGPHGNDGQTGPQPMFNMPASVAWTAGVLIALYVIYLLLPEETATKILLDYAFIPARFGGLPPEYLRITSDGPFRGALTMVTHAALHGGPSHLIFNVLWLIAFATPVARAVGTARYLLLFALSAIAGAAVFWAFGPDKVVIVVGASGAVSGMMGAALRYMFASGWHGRQTLIQTDTTHLAPLTDRGLLTFSIGWLAINLIFGLLGFGVGGETVQIAWEAHVGGFFAGLLLIPLLDRRDEIAPKQA